MYEQVLDGATYTGEQVHYYISKQHKPRKDEKT